MQIRDRGIQLYVIDLGIAVIAFEILIGDGRKGVAVKGIPVFVVGSIIRKGKVADLHGAGNRIGNMGGLVQIL